MVETARSPARLQTLWPFAMLDGQDFKRVLPLMRPLVVDELTTFVEYPNNPCSSLYLVVHGEVGPLRVVVNRSAPSRLEAAGAAPSANSAEISAQVTASCGARISLGSQPGVPTARGARWGP